MLANVFMPLYRLWQELTKPQQNIHLNLQTDDQPSQEQKAQTINRSSTTPGEWPASPVPSPTTDAATDQRSCLGANNNHDKEPCQQEDPHNKYESVQTPISTVQYTIPGRIPAHLIETAQNRWTRNGRLAVLPSRRGRPSWSKLEAKRRATGLDYPCSDDDFEDDTAAHLPPLQVRLSRRGEVYLQARLWEIETKCRAEMEELAARHEVVLSEMRARHKAQLNDLIENSLLQLEELESEHEQELLRRDERIKQLEMK